MYPKEIIYDVLRQVNLYPNTKQHWLDYFVPKEDFECFKSFFESRRRINKNVFDFISKEQLDSIGGIYLVVTQNSSEFYKLKKAF